MGLLDKNNDGRVSIGEAAFAHEQLEEYRKASGGGSAGNEPVGCGFVLGMCGGCLVLVAVLVALVALWLMLG